MRHRSTHRPLPASITVDKVRKAVLRHYKDSPKFFYLELTELGQQLVANIPKHNKQPKGRARSPAHIVGLGQNGSNHPSANGGDSGTLDAETDNNSFDDTQNRGCLATFIQPHLPLF